MGKRPNFIFLIADDHRHRSIGCNGCSDVSTPHLDALARRGTSFDQAHCQGSFDAAVCVPSRASLMTGRDVFALRRAQEANAARFGAHSGHADTIPASMPTFPELLRQAGYRTHGIGKWHNDPASFARSFSSGDSIFFGGMSDHDKVPLHDFDPSGAYAPEAARLTPDFSTDIFRNAAQRFLTEQDAATSFMLYVAFTAPHDPRTPPPGYRANPDALILPADYLPIHPFDNGEAAIRDELLEGFPRSETAIRNHLADYYGMIAHLDAAIGGILATAEAQGLIDNTIIIYTSDHGLAVGSHGLMGKQNLYQHSIGIPLILAGPGIAAGQRFDDLVWHGDTRATVLDLAGVADEGGGENVSLMERLRGGGEAARDTFGAAYKMSQRMIRNNQYKYVRYYPDTDDPDTNVAGCTRGSATEQLFDLHHDPLERVNLAFAPDFQETRAEMITALQEWQRAHSDELICAV